MHPAKANKSGAHLQATIPPRTKSDKPTSGETPLESTKADKNNPDSHMDNTGTTDATTGDESPVILHKAPSTSRQST